MGTFASVASSCSGGADEGQLQARCEEASQALSIDDAQAVDVEATDASSASSLHGSQEPREAEPWSSRDEKETVAVCTLNLLSPPAGPGPDEVRFADGVVRVLTNGEARASLPE